MFYRFCKVLVKFVLNILFNIEVIGEDNIPNSGPVIICPNHKSFWDPVIVACFTKRQIYYMAKDELFHNILSKKVLYGLGAFPVKRGTSDFTAVKTALKILKSEKVLGIFAEGTRSKTEKINRAESGVALLAIKSKSPVIPIAIIGKYRLFGKIVINIGAPFYIRKNALENTNDKYNLNEISQIVITKIKKLHDDYKNNNDGGTH